MGTQKFDHLVDMIQKSVASFGSSEALGTKRNDEWVWTSYTELGRRIDQLRGGLASLGVNKGDAVAIISTNRVEWAVTAYATYGLGAKIVPMYEAQLEEDWDHIIRDSKAKVLITSLKEIYDKVLPWTETIDSLEHIYCMELPASDEKSFEALEAVGRDKPIDVVKLTADDICGFIYTSGTTGKPKGVILSHGNLVSNVNAVHEMLPMDRSDRSVSFLPWAHSFGQTVELHTLLSMGSSIAIAESVPKLIDNFLEVRPTILVSVPRIFNRIYDGLQKKMEEEGGLKKMLFNAGLTNETKRREMAAVGESSFFVELKHKFFDKLVFSKVRERFGGRLKYAFSGGAALSPEVAEFIDKLGIQVYEGYGLTETSPIASANRPGACRIGTIGKAIPGVRVEIDTSVVDDDSDDGEIIVYGPNVMQGYHNLPEETAAVMTEDGGFRTGDRGRKDAEGFIRITGRIKEQYKLENGKYVVPAPIEERMQLSPFIVQVFIHGQNKPYNVALIVPDKVAIEGWAKKEGLSGDFASLCDNEAVHRLIQSELDNLAKTIRSYERIKDFVLVTEEFTTDNGMLTPSMKVKRRVVMQTYGEKLEALYEGSSH
jgi:long-chain acyl-CoA synthetase